MESSGVRRISINKISIIELNELDEFSPAKGR